jgi:hypothetical protein
MLNVTIMSTVPGVEPIVIGLTDWELRPRFDGCVDFVIKDPYVAGRLARAFISLECQLKAHDARTAEFWAELSTLRDETVNPKLPWYRELWLRIHKWIPKGL